MDEIFSFYKELLIGIMAAAIFFIITGVLTILTMGVIFYYYLWKHDITDVNKLKQVLETEENVDINLCQQYVQLRDAQEKGELYCGD